jgi:hypothetical protein
VGRDERFGNGGSLDKIEITRDSSDQPLMRDNVFGLASTAHKTENSVSDVQWAYHIGAEHIDLSGVFEPWNVGGRTGRGRINALALQKVGTVQSAGSHPDPDLVSARLGRRHVTDFQDLRAAVACDNNCFHRLPGFNS